MSRAAAWAGIAVTAIGTLVLSGWFFDLESLKTMYGPIAMKTNTAIAFVLCGVSLALIRLRGRIVGSAAAIVAAAIGLFTLVQHLTGWDLGIDQWLFTEPPGAPATASPNRMGPHASTSFGFAGLALVLLHNATPGSLRRAQQLAFTGLALALLAISGYSYGAVELYGIARYTGIALPTALGLCLLHTGILAAKPEDGPMALFAKDASAGTLLRRLTFLVIIVPLVLGYLVIEGREAEIVDRGLAMAWFAMSIIVVLLVTMWHTAAVIDATDEQRQRARAEADRANRLKDQFIAVLSHELRTPLNVMLGRLRLLEGNADEATRSRAAAIVARNGRLLARLVEDLLDQSRATAGQFEISPSPVPLNTIVRAAVEAVAAEAAAKGVSVVSTLDPAVGLVNVDQQRIQQVIGNLLANAVKFTSAGRVEVRTARTAAGVTIDVADTGIGFDAEFATHLFEPFRQADASSRREHGGLGLGLSIAKHLMELHGGTIVASSPGLGRGATFTIVLPAARVLDGGHAPSEVAGYHDPTAALRD
jgi:signal transduction histidine kinase